MYVHSRSILRLYKRMKPLSDAPVFYGNTRGFSEHDHGRKKNCRLRDYSSGHFRLDVDMASKVRRRKSVEKRKTISTSIYPLGYLRKPIGTYPIQYGRPPYEYSVQKRFCPLRPFSDASFLHIGTQSIDSRNSSLILIGIFYHWRHKKKNF